MPDWTVNVVEALTLLTLTVTVRGPAAALVNVKLSVMLFVCTLLTATLVIPVMFEMVTLAAVAPVRVSPPDDVTVIVTVPEAGTELGLRLICGVAANRPVF